MKIIDAHTHLDDAAFPDLADAASQLNEQLNSANIDKCILLHLEAQPWSAESFKEIIAQYPAIEAFVNINPQANDANEQLDRAINDYGFCGLKLHPRLQEIHLSDPGYSALCKFAGDNNIPVLIDAFPDGTGLMQGFDPLDYAKLAKSLPNTKFIWAHMGGHYVLDMMMLAKRLPNVYFDCSFSLLYYRGSDVPKNMVYAMKSMRFERILYGSDYPDRSIETSLTASLELLDHYGVTESELERLMSGNVLEFMQW
jgi:uncharacterized protein